MIEFTFTLLLFLFPLAYSPGPGNMFFAANGARFGFRATLPSNAGYHAATLAITLIIGLGFGWMADSFPVVLTIIKFLGGAYVMYLAWKLFRAGIMNGGDEAKPAGFQDGVALLILNPKAYLIISLMFSQFTQPGAPVWVVLVIATIFTFNNLVAFSLWAYVGDRLAIAFRTPQHARWLNRIFGSMLALVAAWMLVAK